MRLANNDSACTNSRYDEKPCGSQITLIADEPSKPPDPSNDKYCSATVTWLDSSARKLKNMLPLVGSRQSREQIKKNSVR